MLDRSILEELSPVQKIKDFWFKREDLFAPFGPGGVNGSKLRQLIWLLLEAKEQGKIGVLSGAVAGSPQHPMVSRVAKDLGMKCVVVTGVKKTEDAKMIGLALKNGAKLEYSKIGYAPMLQRKAFELQQTKKYKDYFVLETNITTAEKFNSPEHIRDFHSIGAKQVQNIPDEVETLVLPAGSLNSAVSVLYGLYLYPRPNVKNVWLMGIGSLGTKDVEYAFRRLDGFSHEASLACGKLAFTHHNLNGEGYCSYSDLMPYQYGSIVAHPRYEGKIFNYLQDKGLIPQLSQQNSLIWIVGSEVHV